MIQHCEYPATKVSPMCIRTLIWFGDEPSIIVQEVNETKVCLLQSSLAPEGDIRQLDMQPSSLVGAYRHGSTLQSGQHARFSYRRALRSHGTSDSPPLKWSHDIHCCTSSDPGSVRCSSGGASRRFGSFDGSPSSAPAHHSRTGLSEENQACVDTRAAHEISHRSGEDWPSNCGPAHHSAGILPSRFTSTAIKPLFHWCHCEHR